ncbi:MAG: alginate export family protein [Pseudomonadota bacterium]
MRTTLLASAIALASVSGVAAALPAELEQLHSALHNGKATLELRLRGEYVDYETTPETDAETLRTVLGYRSGDYHGLSGYLEFENVSTLGNGEYNSGSTGYGNGQTQYGLIADPALTQVNQSYLEGYGFRAGRQKLIYDNARFIGDVGWRQNDQTFTAVSFSNATWVKDLTLNAAWLARVHNIYGVDRNVDAPLANLRYAAFPQARLTAFYYAVDEQTAPTTSWQHAGARVDGTIGGFLYDLSYADQTDFASGTAGGAPDAAYTDLQAGYKFGPVTLKLQQETLEKGFKTPLATLHAFNGWADRFLNTPANGLVDSNVKLLAEVAGFNLVLAAHDFEAEASDEQFGQEVDVSVGRKLGGSMSLLVKYAEFNADGSAAGFTNDTRKAWLQLTCKL